MPLTTVVGILIGYGVVVVVFLAVTTAVQRKEARTVLIEERKDTDRLTAAFRTESYEMQAAKDREIDQLRSEIQDRQMRRDRFENAMARLQASSETFQQIAKTLRRSAYSDDALKAERKKLEQAVETLIGIVDESGSEGLKRRMSDLPLFSPHDEQRIETAGELAAAYERRRAQIRVVFSDTYNLFREFECRTQEGCSAR